MRWWNGFEAGSGTFYANYQGISGTTGITSLAGEVHKTTSGEGGTYAMYCGGNATAYTSPDLGTGEQWVNHWFKLTAWNTSLIFYLAGTQQCLVHFSQNTGGYVSIYRGYFVTLLATSATPVPNATDGHWWNVRAKVADAPDGVIAVYIDQPNINGSTVPFVAATGDTQQGASPGWNQFNWTTGGTPMAIYVDDIIVSSEAEGAIGETYILGVVPASNVSVVLVPSAGANWQCVSTVPATTTGAYNKADALAEEDVYGISPIPPGTVLGVGVWVYAARDGVISQIRTGLTIGADTSYSAYCALPASPSWAATPTQFEMLTPAGAAWTAADVAALNVRVQFN